MSTIRKRSNKYQVQVRVQGQKITKSFNNLTDARRWAVFNENKILLGAELQSLNNKISLKDLIIKYIDEVTPLKKGHIVEKQRLRRLLKEPMVNQKVYQLKTRDFLEFKQRRIKDGNRTCAYDLVSVSYTHLTLPTILLV